jgi:hypothetical protein
MMGNLTNVAADDFLKAYWTSRHGRIQSADLFDDFRRKVDAWRKVSDTLADMLRSSEHYVALEVADDPIWNGISEQCRQRIRDLKALGARQIHPVLLSALVRFSEKELQRVLRLLEVLIVRYQLVGGGRTGRLEITCANLAAAIYQRKVKNATEAFSEVRNIFPADKEFFEKFKEKQERISRKARYLLETLEYAATQKHAKMREVQPARTLSIEHIMPRNPNKEWKAVLEKQPNLSEDYTFRLGNLCLLSGVNKDLGRKSFSEKLKIYGQSSLILTKGISNYSEWNSEAIEKRQEEMAKIAVTAWRIDF